MDSRTVQPARSQNNALGILVAVVVLGLIGLLYWRIFNPTPSAPAADASQIVRSAAYLAGREAGTGLKRASAKLMTEENLTALSRTRFPNSQSDQAQFRIGYRDGFLGL